MLGDAAGLALGHLRLADSVEQLRLAVVDVTHHGDDRRPGDQALLVDVLVEVDVEPGEQLPVLLLRADDLHVEAEVLAEQQQRVVGAGLRRRHHLAQAEHLLDQRARVGVDLVGEVGQRSTARQPDHLALTARRARAHRRRGEVVELLPLLALRLATLGLAATPTEGATGAAGAATTTRTAAGTTGTAGARTGTTGAATRTTAVATATAGTATGTAAEAGTRTAARPPRKPPPPAPPGPPPGRPAAPPPGPPRKPRRTAGSATGTSRDDRDGRPGRPGRWVGICDGLGRGPPIDAGLGRGGMEAGLGRGMPDGLGRPPGPAAGRAPPWLMPNGLLPPGRIGRPPGAPGAAGRGLAGLGRGASAPGVGVGRGVAGRGAPRSRRHAPAPPVRPLPARP